MERSLSIQEATMINEPESNCHMESSIENVNIDVDQAAAVSPQETYVEDFQNLPIEMAALGDGGVTKIEQMEEAEDEEELLTDDDDEINYFNYNSEDFDSDEAFCDYDDVSYCDQCSQAWEGHCPKHGRLTAVKDVKVSADTTDEFRAKKTAPAHVTIADLGDGVWTRKCIPARTRFGPYQGQMLPPDAVGTAYTWNIMKNGVVHRRIDGQDTSAANWMRYVRRAEYDGLQNLVAFQAYAKIYYRTIRDVAPNEELLVWYSDQIGTNFGLARQKTPAEDDKGQVEIKSERKKTEAESPGPPIKTAIPDVKPQKLSGKQFEMMRNLKQDERTHSDDEVKDCSRNEKLSSDSSKKQFDSKNQLTTDIDKKTVDLYICNVCKMRFSQVWQLKEHLRSHKRNMKKTHRSKCGFCEKTFSRIAKLQEHVRVHTGERPFQCYLCRKRFFRKCNLHRHFLCHTKLPLHTCIVCSIVCDDKESLAVHTKTHYATPVAKQHDPERKHFLCHTKLPVHTCIVCSVVCDDKESLDLHTKTHYGLTTPVVKKHDPEPEESIVYDGLAGGSGNAITEEKPCNPEPTEFVINVIDAAFREEESNPDKSSLLCPKCNRRFGHRHTLNRHCCTSTYFECFECNTHFPYQKSLSRHMRVHSKERPFYCSECGELFSHKSDFYLHKRNVCQKGRKKQCEGDLYFV